MIIIERRPGPDPGALFCWVLALDHHDHDHDHDDDDHDHDDDDDDHDQDDDDDYVVTT